MPTAMPNTAAVTPVRVSGSEKSKLMPACTRRLLAVCLLEGRWLLHLKAGNCLPLKVRAVRQEGVKSVDCMLGATLRATLSQTALGRCDAGDKRGQVQMSHLSMSFKQVDEEALVEAPLEGRWPLPHTSNVCVCFAAKLIGCQA